MRTGAVILTLLLLLSGAQASSGTLILTGQAHFPPNTRTTGQALAAYTNQTTSITTFTLTAATARIHAYETRWLALDSPSGTIRRELGTTHDELNATNLTITLAARPGPGLIGAYPHAADITMTGVQHAEPRLASHLGNSPAVQHAAEPSDYWYARAIEEPHLLHEATGHVLLEGAFGLRVIGLTLHAVHDDGDAVYRTGRTMPTMLAGESRDAWVFIDAPHTTLTLGTTGVLEAALTATEAAWTGPATLDAAGGAGAPQRRVVLDGAYGARLTPARMSGMPAAYVELAPAQPAVRDVAASEPPSPWAGPLLVIVLLCGAALVLYSGMLRVRRP